MKLNFNIFFTLIILVHGITTTNLYAENDSSFDEAASQSPKNAGKPKSWEFDFWYKDQWRAPDQTSFTTPEKDQLSAPDQPSFMTPEIAAWLDERPLRDAKFFLGAEFGDLMHTPIYTFFRSPLGNLIRAAKKVKKRNLKLENPDPNFPSHLESALLDYSKVISDAYFSKWDLINFERFFIHKESWNLVLKMALAYTESKSDALKWTLLLLGSQPLTPYDVVTILSYYASHQQKSGWLIVLTKELLEAAQKPVSSPFKNMQFDQQQFLSNIAPILIAFPIKKMNSILEKYYIGLAHQLIIEFKLLGLMDDKGLTEKGLQEIKIHTKKLFGIDNIDTLPAPVIAKKQRRGNFVTNSVQASVSCFSSLHRLSSLLRLK